jgi:DNA polymerase elongation subunit (family B)
MIEAVNGGYEGNYVWLLSNSGEVKYYEFSDLEYPYFYSRVKINAKEVVNAEKVKINVLSKKGILKEQEYWKIEVCCPLAISKIKGGSEVCESTIKYLERRLGADGIVRWVKPERYAYIDIETDDGKIVLIGVIDNVSGEYKAFKSVAEFEKWLIDSKIVMVVAWNGRYFDFRYISKDAKSEYWKKVLKLDGMELYVKFVGSVRRGLDWVGKEEGLGGKLNMKTASLEEYNKRDVELLKAIIEKYKLLDVFYELVDVTGLYPDLENLREVSIIENYIMKGRKYDVYLFDEKKTERRESYRGAVIWLLDGGVYENVAVYDYNSLYPSVFMFEDYDSEIYRFWKRLISELYNKKEENRGKDDIKYNIYKIIVNGAYGVFGYSGFRFADIGIASFITAKAREKVLELKSYLEKLGFKVIYLDTDSNFVQLDDISIAKKLEGVINKRMSPYKVKLEKIYKRVFFTVDESGQAKKKRYAGIRVDGKLDIVGLETVRSDYCFLSRETVKNAINIILSDKSVDEKLRDIDIMLKEVKRKLYNREYDIDDLVIVKSVDMEAEYKVETQTLKALKQLNKGKDDIIVFVEFVYGRDKVIARNGKYTDEELKHLIDYGEYWEKQIKTPVLRLVNSLKVSKNSKLEEFL